MLWGYARREQSRELRKISPLAGLLDAAPNHFVFCQRPVPCRKFGALRTVADALGGMAVLAGRTGLSRETLYRTLSGKGNPRLDTLAAILAAFGLRIAVAPVSGQVRRTRGRKAT